jgi:ketosteroid isomerase-like protein
VARESVEVVRGGFSALARGGVAAASEFWHEDINWRAMEGAPDDVGEMNGIDAVSRYIQDWYDMFDDLTSELEEVLDLGGGHVLAVIHNTGRAKLSGVPTELRYAAIYTVAGGKFVRAREYATKSEALQAMGLEE